MLVGFADAAAESHPRSLVKAISWRATGSLDTFGVSWLVTGNATYASSIAVTEVVTKIVLYYAHERVWGRIGWGAGKGAGVDNPGGGP